MHTPITLWDYCWSIVHVLIEEKSDGIVEVDPLLKLVEIGRHSSRKR